MGAAELSRAEQALRDACHARDVHTRDCPAWDFESNNGCAECDEHDREVTAARERRRRARDSA